MVIGDADEMELRRGLVEKIPVSVQTRSHVFHEPVEGRLGIVGGLKFGEVYG
jgi:hypothetical protein